MTSQRSAFVKRIELTIVALALIAVVWFWPAQHQPTDRLESDTVTKVLARTSDAEPTNQPASIGETILADYARPSLSAENDLILLSHLMDNFTLLVKSAATR